MRTKTIVLALALCFVAVPASFASYPNIGTWKLNESKSKITPKAPKNITVVYEAASDNVKVTVDGTDGSGNPTSGRENLMAKTIRSPAILPLTPGRTKTLTTTRPR
jgi:hypothetical protein